MQKLPTAYDVLPLLGELRLPPEEVTTLLDRVVELVRTYTHGAGFTPALRILGDYAGRGQSTRA